MSRRTESRTAASPDAYNTGNGWKQYEDFETIDWVQDATREYERRRRKWILESAMSHMDYIKVMAVESLTTGQSWLVTTLIGITIGVNAAIINVATAFLSDIKLGRCSTHWYLTRKFCCLGVEDDTCVDWVPWTTSSTVAAYIMYLVFAGLFAFTSAFLVREYAPYAAGSGISEIKCIIGGFVMKGFLGAWTLLLKSIGLPLAIASGLSVGKEGPSVHVAVCIGHVISRWFPRYTMNAAKTREILTACSAAGVAVAFGSPIGGVLFSLEEMSAHAPTRTMWRGFFCALIATTVLSFMNPFRTGQLVMFSVSYDRTWHMFEILFFIVIGVFGGVYGELTIRLNLRYQSLRKAYLSSYVVREAVVLALITGCVGYWNPYLRLDMTETMEILFQECERVDYDGLCHPQRQFRACLTLMFATGIRLALVIVSYGAKVPAGIFVPSMAIGATFGRAVGIVASALQRAAPGWRIFSSCQPDTPCVTPGTYAFLGAAAALSGIMHIQISVVVIMFELTGALTFIIPAMIVVGITKALTDKIGHGGGIADRMIRFNNFPFLDNKEEPMFGQPVSAAMRRNICVLPARGMRLEELRRVIETSNFRGFPVVEGLDANERFLLGYFDRAELRRALQLKASAAAPYRLDGNALCVFIRGDEMQQDGVIDLSSHASPTPISVSGDLALEVAMNIFHELGPRVLFVEHRGRLCGLLTVKDILKHQARMEHDEDDDSSHPHMRVGGVVASAASAMENEIEAWIWGRFERGARWLLALVPRWPGRRAPNAGGRVPEAASAHDDRRGRPSSDEDADELRSLVSDDEE